MLLIARGFCTRGLSARVRGPTLARKALPDLRSSKVGRLRKSGWPVAGSFCIQWTKAVHDQTWKSQSVVGAGPLGLINRGWRPLDSHQPSGALQVACAARLP